MNKKKILEALTIIGYIILGLGILFCIWSISILGGVIMSYK